MVMLPFGIDNSKIPNGSVVPSSPPRSRLAGTAIMGCPDQFVEATVARTCPRPPIVRCCHDPSR